MADETHGSSLTWLRGDMHNHCEDHDLVAAHLEGANEQLDFVALTNHAQKPIFFEQHRMVEKARQALPGFPIFFGLEWNAPAGVHAGLVFPPGEREAVARKPCQRGHHLRGDLQRDGFKPVRFSGRGDRVGMRFHAVQYRPAPDEGDEIGELFRKRLI